jgi:hypothetical protein
VEGNGTYSVGNLVGAGNSEVRYVGTLTSFIDTGLTNGTNYWYKVFAKDAYDNYASGVETGPHQPEAAVDDPPDTVSDLEIMQNYARGIKLRWKVPYADAGDNTSGAATLYELRYTEATESPSTMTQSNFETNWAGTSWGGEELRNIALEPTPMEQDTGGTLKQFFTVGCMHPATGLSGNLTAGETSTINVNSTDGFESPGKIKIDNEIIQYTGTTVTTFTGLTRGSDSTTAAAHSSGDLATLYPEDCASAGDPKVKLMPNTLYYFSLKAKDDLDSIINCQGGAQNCSGASNVPGWDNPTGTTMNSHTALTYGWNTFSLPYDWATDATNSCLGGGSWTLANIFGDDISGPSIYKWDATNQQYVGLATSTNLTSMTNGVGYYIRSTGYNNVLDERNSSNTQLVCENAATTVTVQLLRDASTGWNLIGNPWLKNLDLSDINRVKICVNSGCTGTLGTDYQSFRDAADDGWVGSGVYYGYNQSATDYEPCNTALGCDAKLRPWWGQWIEYPTDSPKGTLYIQMNKP